MHASRRYARFLRSILADASRAALPCAALVASLTAVGAATEPAPGVAVPIVSCAAAALYLEDQYESVQVGGRALTADTVLGGPAACVGDAKTDSSNVRVTVQKKGQFASIRVWALHEGFANVSVADARGAEIGVIRVSVYPRELHVHRGGR